jgi:hypothetical protein
MKSHQFAISVFLFLIFQTCALRAQQSSEADSTAFARISFETTAHNFGDVNQNEKVEQIFTFTNTGTTPLILQNVLTTCGCTVPEWPKEPVAPGAEGELKVIFDSTAKIGRQNKVITIRSNSKSGDFRLRISAMVLPPKD